MVISIRIILRTEGLPLLGSTTLYTTLPPCLPELVRRLPQLEEIHVSDDCVDFTDVPDDFMIETLGHDDSSFAIRQKKLSYFSLDPVDRAALPMD